MPDHDQIDVRLILAHLQWQSSGATGETAAAAARGEQRIGRASSGGDSVHAAASRCRRAHMSCCADWRLRMVQCSRLGAFGDGLDTPRSSAAAEPG